MGTQVRPPAKPEFSTYRRLSLACVWWPGLGQARRLWGPVPSPTNTPPTLPGSSDDGDEALRRCREAAVSASDILQESAIHGHVPVEKKKKRKLKNKAKKEDSADVATTATSKAAVGRQEKESAQLNGDQAPPGTKKKKRKKKTKKPSEASPSPPTKSAAAVPSN